MLSLIMKDTHDSDASSHPQTLLNGDKDDGDDANSLPDSHYIVVELEDEDLKAPETETDLSIFAPVESCESEKDEHSDSSGVSSWRRTNARERVFVTDNCEDVAPPEKQKSSRSVKGRRKRRQKCVDEQRAKQKPECGAADRGMSKGLPPPLPQSDSAGDLVKMSGLHTVISPFAAMEPPVFPNTPVMSKSIVGEDQQNLLLEVLNHCRFLHAAVERLEQKIDRQMRSYERQSKLSFEEEQLSLSLAQRLGPPVERNPQWIPPWKRSTAQHGLNRADLHMDNSSLQSTKYPGGERGKARRRGRGRRGRNNKGSKPQSQTPDFAPHMSKPLRDGIFIAEMDDPQPSKVIKKSSQFHTGSKGKQNKKKRLAQVDGDQVESEKTPRKDVTLKVEVDKKVMIGSPIRKVWIPLSVYKEAFKETEPQKALVPVLYSLFPSSTLSCSAVTGNPAKGIKQLDPNKIEALREFLAEMYPQFDVSLKGMTWALCVGVINNITKDLKKKGEKLSHLPEKVGDSENNAVLIRISKDLEI